MANEYKLVKPKYKSIKELEPQYDLKLKNKNPRRLASKYGSLQLLEQAESRYKQGDIENAFILVMKNISILTYIRSTPEYRNDEKYYKAMIGHDLAKSVVFAEKIKPDLVNLYNKNGTLDGKFSDGPVESLDLENRKNLNEISDTITCAGLYSVLRSQDTKVLIIDTRSSNDFNSSHVKDEFAHIINVPNYAIQPGLSAQMVEEALPPSSIPTWKDRGSFDKVVIADYGLDRDKAPILRKILMEFDRVTYKGLIQILEEGYEGWMQFYPWCVTNPLPIPQTVTSAPVIDLNKIDFDLDFDVDHDAAKPYFNRASKPVSVPIVNYAGTIPSVNRSTKPAALKKYEAQATLLQQKEQQVAEALQVGKERLHRERALQEDLRCQKELLLDAERFSCLVEEGAKLINQIDQLKSESLSKDAKIRELQKLIEENENSEGPKIPSIEEQEIGEKIRKQEEETERLKKESDALEKQHEAERRALEETIKKKIEKETPNSPAKAINPELNNHRPVVPERPRIPHVNRSTKPTIEVAALNPVIGESPGLTGLKNLGNTCYMNSILQCISNNSELAKYFSESHYREHLNRNHLTRGEVAEKVAGVVRVLWSGRYRYWACADFKHTVGSIKSEYKTYEQQDSHEFLTFLMEWLHNDLKKECPLSIEREVKSEVEKAWINFKMKNESLISTLFYGLQRSTVTCLRCKEQSHTYEPFSNLSLIIPEGTNVTLNECLQLYLKTELISGWRCPKCKDERQAQKRTELCKLPSILVIHLKRFSFLEVHSQKRATFVDFPLENLILKSSVDRHQTSYSLYGVSNHYGTMEGGHYTAYCKNSLFKRWYKFDDHEVVELSPSDVKTSAAYILFYNSPQHPQPA